MSGIEFIVATVLALVPIALETYDRSGRVFEVFSVSKQYPREVLTLEVKLAAQRTIFRNNTINLLTAITKDRVRVQEVMNNPSSQSARMGLVMATVYQHQVDALDESFVACRQVAEQIHNTLQLLCHQSDAFRAEVGDKQEVRLRVNFLQMAGLIKQQKMSTSDWLKHIRTRFKLGLNKPQIKGAIEELRDSNRDFGLITEQITKALQETLNEDKDDAALTHKSARSLNILQRYHRVRYASKALYSTLQVRWMCTSHRSHSFDVRILDCDAAKGKNSLAEYVTCELAITHDGSAFTSGGPLRLEIEQACESDDEDISSKKAVKDNRTVQQLTTVLETNAERFKLVKPTPSTTKVRKLFKGFRKDKQQQPGPSTSGPQLPNPPQSLTELHVDKPTSKIAKSSSFSDLSLVDDFCKKFHKVSTDCIDRSLLGSWKGPHAQWFCTPPAPQTALGKSQSISDIIHWIAEEPVLRSLPRPLLVELAGSMAEGIMQFYSTPWLVPTNLGQTLRYFNPGESSAAAIQLKGPYFMAQLECKRAKGKMPVRPTSTGPLPAGESAPQNREKRTVDFTEARNKLLFNFGILLLEIGYGRPWHDLKQSVGKTPPTRTAVEGKKKMLSDYQAAEKLAQLLVNQMGLTYPKIIKKCLGCDFGLGETDLDNEDLQRRFLEDVVSGLQRLRDHMREMNFAPLG